MFVAQGESPGPAGPVHPGGEAGVRDARFVEQGVEQGVGLHGRSGPLGELSVAVADFVRGKVTWSGPYGGIRAHEVYARRVREASSEGFARGVNEAPVLPVRVLCRARPVPG
ncbi:hypothetical protein GCM10010497_35470 [Streptomyces cinereoruber]|uniref:Uncharacterized protein n=1 Tax=Streptomyces cinereoruber TaxID=67260 RepID=A0AAV4KJH1_9ACTN|nr:hypothetical protein GCM10010497_35470 [Streptomyces cinereoruber]